MSLSKRRTISLVARQSIPYKNNLQKLLITGVPSHNGIRPTLWLPHERFSSAFTECFSVTIFPFECYIESKSFFNAWARENLNRSNFSIGGAFFPLPTKSLLKHIRWEETIMLCKNRERIKKIHDPWCVCMCMGVCGSSTGLRLNLIRVLLV